MTVPASERVPNLTLRRIRLALQMSQSEFAKAIRHAGDALGEPNTANKRLVQKWESGEHKWCRNNYKRALQSVTRMPIHELGFGRGPDSTDTIVVPPPRAENILESGFPLDERSDPMGAPGDRLRFALEPPTQADAEHVTLAEAESSQLFGLEQHQPSRELMPMVGRHVDDVATLLAGTRRESSRHRLALAGGTAAALAGWLAFDLNDPIGAHRYWDSALAAARYATNGPLLACIFTYMSYSAAERGDPSAAWQLAHAAVAHAGPDARARSWMAARAAEEAARLGERRAALAELDLALSLGSDLKQPPPDADALPWTRFFYNSVLAAMAANVHGRLGNVHQAHDSATWAVHTVGTPKIKSSAFVLVEVSCAAARAGNVELAVESAFSAIEISERLEITMTKRKLRSLIGLLGPYANSDAVRKLFEAVSLLTGKQVF